MSDDDSIDVVKCPKCGSFEEDYDNLGFVRCNVCGYCAHVSVTNGYCDYCGQRIDA